MLTIRQATPGDAAALHELYTRHLTQTPPEEPQDTAQWSALLAAFAADPGYHLLVGELDGRVVSSVTVIVIQNLTHNLRPYAVIENVVTHADFRDRGYASALMEAASEIARENNCYKIMLLTGSKKESTLRFYGRCGFDMHAKTAFLKRL
ncbi:MAG: GNAT family N-acetyltransferase [Oscillospiraceae bacterium]|jgi:GNAT superfamily N-acetyltransferase|nr:GNAT family N-acetyltransferase [Oscillospiraceae bacterium]